ncbi:YncE family protein [Candidatus Omnitrophota bacterium]
MYTLKTILTAVIFFTLAAGPALSEVPDLKKAKEYESRIPVEVIEKIPLSKGYHEGLYFDGKNVWVSNGKKGNTWVVDPATGDIVSEIESVGPFTEGITSAGDGTYWVTDWEEKKLYRVKIEEGKMIPEYDISLEPAHPTGVVWTGEKLYIITWTRSAMGTTYHLMQLNKEEHMSREMRIKRIYEPAHMVWDGRHLWITSWYSQRVYKVDVNTFKVLGSFESPAKDTTGIAWDGEYFWITGSHAALYKIKVGKK